MKNIYQLALGCKKISDERNGTDRPETTVKQEKTPAGQGYDD
jgi:hypothetical protein